MTHTPPKTENHFWAEDGPWGGFQLSRLTKQRDVPSVEKPRSIRFRKKCTNTGKRKKLSSCYTYQKNDTRKKFLLHVALKKRQGNTASIHKRIQRTAVANRDHVAGYSVLRRKRYLIQSQQQIDIQGKWTARHNTRRNSTEHQVHTWTNGPLSTLIDTGLSGTNHLNVIYPTCCNWELRWRS